MDSGALLLPQSAISMPDSRGGWPAARLLIAVAFLERVGFFGVQGNLIMYMSGPLGMSTAAAAVFVNAWSGTAFLLPLLGALAADSWIGRYRAVVVAGVLYLLSLGMLTVSAMLPQLQDEETSSARMPFFYVGLYMVALAQGFHKPCAQAFGADQFEESGTAALASRSSFFNWFNVAVSSSITIALAVISYLEDNVGWAVGFGVCWAMMLVSLSAFLLGKGLYRPERPREGKPFALVTKTFATVVRAWMMPSLSPPNNDVQTARLTAQDGEEHKGLAIMLVPIWTTSVVYTLAYAQASTFFTKQCSTMDRRVGHFVVPPAALQCFVGLTAVVVLPIYDRALVPLARSFTGHPSGVTMLQRVGTGMAISCATLVVAAIVEAKRLGVARDAGLLDQPLRTVPMSVWWMLPQYVLLGISFVFTVVGLEEFFYDQMPVALRSVGVALSLSVLGVGSYASSMLVSSVDWATRSKGESWFSNNINHAHLDYFYWLVAGLSALSALTFLHFARRYIYTNREQAMELHL